jgi:hypothetical protein
MAQATPKKLCVERKDAAMVQASDIAETLASVDREIANLEGLSLLAHECGFQDLVEQIARDLATGRRERCMLVAMIRPAP